MGYNGCSTGMEIEASKMGIEWVYNVAQEHPQNSMANQGKPLTPGCFYAWIKTRRHSLYLSNKMACFKLLESDFQKWILDGWYKQC